MSPLSPSTVLSEVAAAVPEICRQNIIVIGSLAAGYHFFGEDGAEGVRTKDVDCVLEPFAAAVEAGQTITRQLLDAPAGRDAPRETTRSRAMIALPQTSFLPSGCIRPGSMKQRRHPGFWSCSPSRRTRKVKDGCGPVCHLPKGISHCLHSAICRSQPTTHSKRAIWGSATPGRK